jgi:hypothetical protein
MSLYVGSSDANHGEKTSGVIDHNSAYTWMAWVDLVSDTNTYGHIWSAETVPNEWYNADWIGTDSDGTTLRWGAAISATETSVTGGSLSTDTPAHVCLVRSSATSLSAYLNGASAGSASTQDIAGRASTVSESLGNLSTYPCPVRLTAIKQWQAALTADEISAEMHSIRPLRLANLHSWHPAIANTLTDALKDCSGNGRDWTSQGTNTVETQSAPVSWGAGPVIILPVTVTTQNLAPVSDVSAGSWTPSSGTDLYAMLDETAYSDADYIYATSATTCTLALASGSDPSSSTGHILRYRLLAGSGKIAVTLKQSTTTIASWGPHTLTGAAQDFAQTLTSGEADSITDYTALRVEFTSSLT